jgi:hypothetical protein
VSERRIQVESALRPWNDDRLVTVVTVLVDEAVKQDRRRILAKFDALVAVMFGLEDK